MKFYKVIIILIFAIVGCTSARGILPLPEKESVKIVNSSYANLPRTPYSESKFIIWEEDNFLHFREYSLTNKPRGNVLMIHGFAASTFSFRHNISVFLENSYRVVLVDLPGFGYSMRKKNLDTSAQARAKLLWKFIFSLSTEKQDLKWIIMGHSMGGEIALYMAQENPKKVEKLFLIAPAINTNNKNFFQWIAYIPFFSKILKSILYSKIQDKETFAKILYSAYRTEPFYPLEEEILGYQQPLLLPGTVENALDLIKNSNNLEPLHLSQIDIPVYIFQGGKDTWIPAQNTLSNAEFFLNSKVIYYPKLGHCPMETNYKTFNQDIELMLKNNF